MLPARPCQPLFIGTSRDCCSDGIRRARLVVLSVVQLGGPEPGLLGDERRKRKLMIRAEGGLVNPYRSSLLEGYYATLSGDPEPRRAPRPAASHTAGQRTRDAFKVEDPTGKVSTGVQITRAFSPRRQRPRRRQRRSRLAASTAGFRKRDTTTAVRRGAEGRTGDEADGPLHPRESRIRRWSSCGGRPWGPLAFTWSR